MIGATLIALFGFDLGQVVLMAIAPTCTELEDHDQYGCELNTGPVVLWLQWPITKLEAARDAGHIGKGKRILKTLGGT
ncbi:MAG: hypothetical protein M3P26_04460 [Gemmatimonadota bacterium]|nr:hypothetical protein [Gemmatimonadota bacterium]